MRFVVFLAACIAAVAAYPGYGKNYTPERIVGGQVTTIDSYPSIATVLFSPYAVTYSLFCGGSVLNYRSILTAAHCTIGWVPANFRVRVGSTWASSGGFVHNIAQIVNHASYNSYTYDNDIAILRSATTIYFTNQVVPASIASANYNLADNQVVWAAGWGAQWAGGPTSEQLRHVQIWTVNQNTCAERYSAIRMTITANMLCSGWLNVGGRDQCQRDSGGPLYHNGVTVGVCSFGQGCAEAYYPGVNTRVSRYTAWIQNNA